MNYTEKRTVLYDGEGQKFGDEEYSGCKDG